MLKHTIKQIHHDYYLIPKGVHTQTLIFLHGLGDQASSYLDFFSDRFPIPLAQENTKIILLTAPMRKITKYNETTTSWFDMKKFPSDYNRSLTDEEMYSFDEAEESRKRIQQILDQESGRLFIGGFSQGCAMALHSGLSYSKPIQAIFGFSGFLFKFTKQIQQPHLYMTHGVEDDVIPLRFAQETYKLLPKHTLTLEKNTAHSFGPEGLQIMSKILQE